jgi:hypothetical protein
MMADREALHVYSERMFRSKYRLEVSCAIAELDGALYLRSIAEAAGLRDAQAFKAVQQLLELKLLVRLPDDPNSQAKYYDAVASAYWQFCIDLRAEVLAKSHELQPDTS